MKAQDIEFVKSEAISIKTDGYAKRSKLPRRTANAIIVRKLSEDLDTEVPRSNYVNILMEIGISRRSAYRLVDEAYKAKFTRSVQPAKTTSPVAIPALTASSAHNAPASYEQLPSVPPAGQKITWPPEVEAVINGAKANITDLMVAAYSVGVMRGKEEVTKEEATKPLEAIASRAEHMGSFLRAAIIDATRDGVIDGRDGIYKKRSPVERFLTVQGCPEFSGKPVSVFVPSGKKIAAENAWDRAERKRAENERLDGLLAPNTTCYIWDSPALMMSRNKEGEMMAFSELSQAVEFAKFIDGAIVMAVENSVKEPAAG